MINSIDAMYYRRALASAASRNLTEAAALAGKAAQINPENANARRLLGICLYEMGRYNGAATALQGFPGLRYAAMVERMRSREIFTLARKLVKTKKWRRLDVLLRGARHQSTRILVFRGCLAAAVKQYKDAAALFALALEKDRGNRAAGAYLTEAARRI